MAHTAEHASNITGDFLTPDQLSGVREAEATVRNQGTETAITSDSLRATAPLNVPTKPVVNQQPVDKQKTNTGNGETTARTGTPVDGMLDSATTTEEQEIERTKEQGQSDDITQGLFDAVGATRGEFADRANAAQAAKDERKQLQAINSKIGALDAEIAQDDVKLIANQRAEEVRDTLLPFARSNQAKLAGDAAILRALKTSEKGVLVAQAYAKQGDIALAINEANSAVDAKYAPYKEDIAIFTKQLEVLAPTLNKQEKEQAASLLRKNTLADKEIDRIASEEKTKQDIYFSAIEGGATTEQANAILESENINDALKAAGTFIGKQDRILKSLQIANENTKLKISKAELAADAARLVAIENRTEINFVDLTEDQQDTTLKLRKEYGDEDQTKEFVKVRGAYNRVVASAVDPSAAGDLALIFNYMKVLDPGSTVREGEFATAATSAGVPDIVRAKYNKVRSGERLAEAQRNDFVARAGKLFEASQSEQDALNKDYESLASSAQLPVEFITRSTNRAEDDESTALEGIYGEIVPDPTSPTSILDNILNAFSQK